MFLRSVKAANRRHEYLRLVENYRQGDKIRQRVVLHVGRKDLLAPHLDTLVRLLQSDQQNPTWVSGEEVSTPQAWTWGPVRDDAAKKHPCLVPYDELPESEKESQGPAPKGAAVSPKLQGEIEKGLEAMRKKQLLQLPGI